MTCKGTKSLIEIYILYNIIQLQRFMHEEDIKKKLEELVGKEIYNEFGQPFTKIFEQAYNGNKNDIQVAAYTCSLFLSCLLAKMPTVILNTFVYYTKERDSRFSFNCNMYETLFTKIEGTDLENIPLFSEKKELARHTLTKQDIFEAFDFYTNS